MWTTFLLLLAATPALGGYIPPGVKFPCPPTSYLLYPCTCTRGSDQGLYVSCANTNLASLAVGITNAATLRSPIVQLTISNATFGRLYGDLLYALEVNSLVIENTPITQIDEETFRGVNRSLTELHLVNTSLNVFPSEVIKILGKLSILDIQGHNITSLEKGSLSGEVIHSLTKFTLSIGELSSISPDALSPCKKLKRIDLHGNKLTALQRNQFKGLRDVEVLDISFNSIKIIDSGIIGDLNKLTWLNASHNEMKDISRGAFARNTVLRSLNLSFNKITKLDSNSLKGMRFIRRLYLSDNEISEVGRDTFGAVSRIGTVDLARNKLKKVDFKMFSQLQYAEVIDVSENQITVIEKMAFTDLYLVHINLSHNNISKIEPGAFINCANITELDFSYNNIQDITPKAFDDITYATYLQMSYNLLTDLSKVPFANMTGLKVLNITNNRLIKIPRSTFPKLYELHTIDLSHNLLSDIFPGVFTTLFGLRSLNLSNNAIKELKSSMLGPLPTLLKLDLSHNLIKKVSNGALTRLGALQTLDMSYNYLESLFEIPIALNELDVSFNAITSIGSWPTMNALLGLNLSHNVLEDNIHGGNFANLLTLRYLDLSDNGITQPPKDALRDLSSLQFLYLKNNSLYEIGEGAFGTLPVVFELHLSENLIHNVSKKAFDGLLQLLKLDLSNNEIASLPNGAFEGLVSLRHLDLSHNTIEAIDNKTHGLLDDCLSLETINLSHNRISFVSRKTFPSNPYYPYKLRHVDLSYNTMPALTYDITFGTKTLLSLNLSHNMINEIRKGVIGNLTSLESLDLSYNDLESLTEKGLFVLPQNLTKLYLSHNNLQTLPVTKLPPRMQLLDLTRNKLEFYNDITTWTKNGTTVLFAGNTVTCDCNLRPLRRWLLDELGRSSPWEGVLCSHPPSLSGQHFLAVQEKDLDCSASLESDEFDTTPDLKFREISRTSTGRVILTWYVTTKEDIADFDLIIRESESPQGYPVMRRHFSYNTRTVAFSRIPTRSKNELELCVIGINSKGQEREPHRLQCQAIPSSWSGAAVNKSIIWLCLILVLNLRMLS